MVGRRPGAIPYAIWDSARNRAVELAPEVKIVFQGTEYSALFSKSAESYASFELWRASKINNTPEFERQITIAVKGCDLPMTIKFKAPTDSVIRIGTADREMFNILVSLDGRLKTPGNSWVMCQYAVDPE